MSSPELPNYYEDCPVRPEALLLFGERSGAEKLAEFDAKETQKKVKRVFRYVNGRRLQ